MVKAVHEHSGQAVLELSGEVVHALKFSGHLVVNSISAESHRTWRLCTQLGSSSSTLSVGVVVVRELRQLVNCVIVFIWFSRFTCFPSGQPLLASSGVWGKFSTHSFSYHFQTFFIVLNIFLHPTHIYRKNSENKPQDLYFSKACFEGLIIGGAYIQRGLSMEGNLHFKIDWASLIGGRKLTLFALF